MMEFIKQKDNNCRFIEWNELYKNEFLNILLLRSKLTKMKKDLYI